MERVVSSSNEPDGVSTLHTRRRRTGQTVWDALVGGLAPGLTVVYGPPAATALLIYQTLSTLAPTEEWKSDAVAVGVGPRRARAAGATVGSSVSTAPLKVAELSELRRIVSAFRGGVVVVDDIRTISRHCRLIRPSRETALEFEQLIELASATGTAVLAIGALDLASRPSGGSLWADVASDVVRLYPRSPGASLGEFSARVEIDPFGPSARTVRPDVVRNVWIDYDGLSLCEAGPSPSVTIRATIEPGGDL